MCKAVQQIGKKKRATGTMYYIKWKDCSHHIKKKVVHGFTEPRQYIVPSKSSQLAMLSPFCYSLGQLFLRPEWSFHSYGSLSKTIVTLYARCKHSTSSIYIPLSINTYVPLCHVHVIKWTRLHPPHIFNLCTGMGEPGKELLYVTLGKVYLCPKSSAAQDA